MAIYILNSFNSLVRFVVNQDVRVTGSAPASFEFYRVLSGSIFENGHRPRRIFVLLRQFLHILLTISLNRWIKFIGILTKSHAPADKRILRRTTKSPIKRSQHQNDGPETFAGTFDRYIHYSIFAIILDCGGKRSATPLWNRSKAPSPLRSAGAVHI